MNKIIEWCINYTPTECKMCIRDSVYADKSETLKNFKVHLNTDQCKNLMKIMFEMIPEKFQSNNEFILYKGDYIMCSPVSYTHLDVYKRQTRYLSIKMLDKGPVYHLHFALPTL